MAMKILILILCFNASTSFLFRSTSCKRTPVKISRDLGNFRYNPTVIGRIYLKPSANTIEQSTRKNSPAIIRFLRNIWTLALGNFLLVISFPFKFLSKLVNGKKNKSAVPEPVISKTLKAVSVSSDLQVEEAYIQKQENAAYKAQKEDISAAKKVIEKQLLAIDKMKKTAAMATTAATIQPTVTTAVGSVSEVLESVASTPIVIDMKAKMETAMETVETFISGVKPDEDAQGVIVSRVPLREVLSDAESADAVETATIVVTKLYSEENAVEPTMQSPPEVNMEQPIVFAASVASVPDVSAPIDEVLPESDIAVVECGPYDMNSVIVPNLSEVKAQLCQSLREHAANYATEWKASRLAVSDSQTDKELSTRLAEIMGTSSSLQVEKEVSKAS